MSPNSRIYIIHNGTDAKQRHLIISEFKSNDLIFHILMEKNLGYSGGLNFGLKNIFLKEDFVFVLTNDTELSDVPAYAVQPGIVIPLILNKRTKKTDSFGGYFLPAQSHLYHNKDIDTDFTDSHNRLTYVPGSAFLIDKTSFLKSKGFWEDLGTYWEDVEWSQRIKEIGLQLQLNSDFKLFHKIGKTCHKDKYYTTYLYQRNRIIVSWLYTNSFQKLLLLSRTFLNIFLWTYRAVVRSNFNSLGLFFRANWHAVKMIKEHSRRPQRVR